MTALYVDSVNGSDANSGLSTAAPKQTLTAAQTAYDGDLTIVDIFLKRGSSWTLEKLDLDDRTGAKVNGLLWGTGNIPVIDCRDTLSAGGWTLSAHGDAGGVVYERSVTRNKASSTAVEYHHVWEDDAYLSRTTSVAACAALPGSFYAVSDQLQTTTLYLHPLGSTNPTSDGKTYKWSKQNIGIEARSAPQSRVTGVKVVGAWDHYGGIAVGFSGVARRFVIRGGGVHHTVCAADLIEDVITLQGLPGTQGGGIAITRYAPVDLTGQDIVFRRCHVNGGTATAANVTGFYAHGTAGILNSATFEQCSILGGSTGAAGFTADTVNKVLRGCYTDQGGMGSRDHLTFDRTILRGMLSITAAPSSEQFVWNLTDSIIWNDTAATGGALAFTSKNGAITVNRSILRVDPAASNRPILTNEGDAQTTINVTNSILIQGVGQYFQVGTNLSPQRTTMSGSNILFVGNSESGTYRGSGVTFANFGATIGLTNYARMTATQYTTTNGGLWLGNPDDGDFRINPAAVCTWPNGTVSTTLPDGTPLTALGPQNHWDYATRASASGPPTAWPTAGGATSIPTTEAEAQTYLDALPMALTDGISTAWKLNETSDGSGAVTRNDSVGSSHLTDVNTTPSGAGKLGTAASFAAASNEHLSLASAAGLGIVLTQSFTCSAWFNAANLATARRLCGGMRTVPNRGMRVSIESALIDVDLFDGTTQSRARITATINTGTWYHLIWGWNASDGKAFAYLNNGSINQGAVNTGAAMEAGEFRIGHDPGLPSGTNQFDGLVDDFYIWNARVLTAGERTLLYNAGNGVAYPFSGSQNLLLLGVG